MPNDYDKILKENFEPLLPHLLRQVLGSELTRMEDLKDKLQVTIEREMDNLKKVIHEDPALDFGLHWEIQSADEDMRPRNLFYYGLFYQRYKLPLKQIVVYVGDAPAKAILQNTLQLEGLVLNFSVVNLKNIPKDVFLQSETPESVILAILADFGSEQPEVVIRQILQHLLKLVGRVPRLKKYQRQLQVLSRLRKLEIPVKKEITAMPIHYEIETDGLYLEGIEKGIEKGIEAHRYETVVRMLKSGKYTMEEIVLVAAVTDTFIRKVAEELNIKL